MSHLWTAAAAQAEYGKTYSFTAAVPTGSEISGQCSNTLDYTNRHVSNNQWRLLRTAEDPSNNDILPLTRQLSLLEILTNSYKTLVLLESLGHNRSI